MKRYELILLAIICGIAVTLVSGLYNSTPTGLLGAVWYGLPLAWIRYLLVGPQYNPWVVDYAGLLADIAAWSVIAGVLIFASRRLCKKKRKRTKKKSR